MSKRMPDDINVKGECLSVHELRTTPRKTYLANHWKQWDAKPGASAGPQQNLGQATLDRLQWQTSGNAGTAKPEAKGPS